MINFRLGEAFWLGLHVIAVERHNAACRGSEPVDEQTHLLVKRNIEVSIENCISNLSLTEGNSAAIKVQDLFNLYPRYRYTNNDLEAALARLYEDITIGIRQEAFFHYPREIAKIVQSVPLEWASILESFPSSRREIESGMDCFAFEDYAGCVFHMVRIAELGLRTVATERGTISIGRKPLEFAMWQEVFQEIEKKLSNIRNAAAGPNRDEAMNFYRGALSDLRFLQGYRDKTMHFRETYGKGEAYDALHRAKTLMMRLATRLTEDISAPIDWGL